MEALNCPICLEIATDPQTTLCGHIFCNECIAEHLCVSELSRCPVCRRNVDIDDLQDGDQPSEPLRWQLRDEPEELEDSDDDSYQEQLDRAIAQSLADMEDDAEDQGMSSEDAVSSYAGSLADLDSDDDQPENDIWVFPVDEQEEEVVSEVADDDSSSESDTSATQSLSSDLFEYSDTDDDALGQQLGTADSVRRHVKEALLGTIEAARRNKRSIVEGALFSEAVKAEARSRWDRIKQFVGEIEAGVSDRTELHLKERMINFAASVIEDICTGRRRS